LTPLSLAVAAVLHLTPLRLFPEPRAADGPRGATGPDREVPVPPITGHGTEVAELAAVPPRSAFDGQGLHGGSRRRKTAAADQRG
jgi:hypothetical protein